MSKKIYPLDKFCNGDVPKENGYEIYFITLTLNPNLYHYEGSKQMDRSEEDLLDIFETDKCTIIAEYTKQCNIHYHILATDITQNRRITLHKRIYKKINKLGNVIGKSFVFKKVFDLQGVIKYMNKDIVRIYKDDMDIIEDKNSYVYSEYLARQQFDKEELIGMMKYL